jgi:transaldolase/glucose-6-phosphate isomerase
MTQTLEKNVSVSVSSTDFSKYSSIAENAVNDIKQRAGKSGQFLNWIKVLPENQLKNLDSLFSMAEEAKKGGFTDLAILGIGGSRHTTESMVNMLGVESHVHFYSSVDPKSFAHFAESLNLDKTKFMVVSKSGGTLETTVAYNSAKKLLSDYLETSNLSDRFIAMTDKSSEKSKLRRCVDAGDINISGYVHDDVGGRFSIFDDATIFTLAFLGVSKDDVKAMLNSSLTAQEEFLSSDINSNDALKLASFNVESVKSGKIKHFVEYFGNAFQGATLWEKQMKNESLKSRVSTDTNVGPGYLHYNAESDLDSNNKDSFFTFVYEKMSDKTFAAVLQGVIKAYSSQHPVSIIELSNMSYSAIGRFIELKHFETIYTGNMLRQSLGIEEDSSAPLPEVVQPNVEKYKAEVKKFLN